MKAGWINDNTPPPGFILDNDGDPSLSTHLVVTVRASMMGEVNTDASNDPNATTMVTNLNTLPSGLPPPVPQVVMTQPINAGNNFDRSGLRVQNSDASTIATVTVNGRNYTGPLFDAQGNQIA